MSGHAQGNCDFVYVVQRDILLATLDCAQIGPVDVGFRRKSFLRPFPLRTKQSDAFGEHFAEGASLGAFHSPFYLLLMVLTLPVLRYNQRLIILTRGESCSRKPDGC